MRSFVSWFFNFLFRFEKWPWLLCWSCILVNHRCFGSHENGFNSSGLYDFLYNWPVFLLWHFIKVYFGWSSFFCFLFCCWISKWIEQLSWRFWFSWCLWSPWSYGLNRSSCLYFRRWFWSFNLCWSSFCRFSRFWRCLDYHFLLFREVDIYFFFFRHNLIIKDIVGHF